MSKVALDISGMTCAACASRVEKVLSRLEGVVGTLPMMLGTGMPWIGSWTQALLATGVALTSGTRFIRKPWVALRGGSANMAVLVSLGTSVAYLYSLLMVISGDGGGSVVTNSALLARWRTRYGVRT